MLPTLFGDLAMSLDDDSDHLLLDRGDVHNLDLAIFETKYEVTSPRWVSPSGQWILFIFVWGALSSIIYESILRIFKTKHCILHCTLLQLKMSTFFSPSWTAFSLLPWTAVRPYWTDVLLKQFEIFNVYWFWRKEIWKPCFFMIMWKSFAFYEAKICFVNET